MPTQRKVEIVDDLTDKMTRMQLAVVADYRGFTVADLTALRAKLREQGAEMVVAKNTLLRLAARNTGREAIEPLLTGPTAVAFAYDNVAKVAKILLDASKVPAKPLMVRGGMLGASTIPATELEQVTKLPTRNEALAQVLGTISAPISGVAAVLNTAISNVALVVQARIDQLQPAGESAA